MMKNILFLFLIASLIIPIASSEAASTVEEYGIVINLAGKQRMLTQKMAKETLLIFAGIDAEKNRKNLRHTVRLFMKTLDGLRDGDTSLNLPPTQSPAIKTQIDVVKSEFNKIESIFKRVIAGEAPSRDAVMEIAERNSAVLENMNIVVEMYERKSREIIPAEKAFLGIEINLSGKQRMLSQKMAKEALLIYLGIDRRKNKILLRETYRLFDRTLNGLKYGGGELGLPGTTEKDIAQQLDSVIKVWEELKPAIEKSFDIMVDKVSKEEIIKIANLNVLILDEMDKAVGMYEALAKKQ